MKICNLDYLKEHSARNPKFVTEMIQLFLKKTPEYLDGMKKSLADSDWNKLKSIAHTLRPSVDLIGLPKDIGATIKQIEEYCNENIHLDLIPDLFLKVEKTFQQAYKELEDELKHEVIS
jgi:HPt (histidine-containing phosphotransfer) domain-containing protein